MMLKNSSEDPKLWYAQIPNHSENDNVTVLNCSLIGGGKFVSGRIAESVKPQYGIPRVPGSSLCQAAH
jgi:hypothetical protein